MALPDEPSALRASIETVKFRRAATATVTVVRLAGTSVTVQMKEFTSQTQVR